MAAAQTLVDEEFGLCLRWSRRDGIDTFIQSVLDHIGAVLYNDRSTALFTLKLIRGDYVKSALKLWDTSSGILEINDSSVNTATLTVNEIIVEWKDPIYNEVRTVNEQNLASIQSNSGVMNTKTMKYVGLPTPGLARRVALRDLRAHSQGLRKFKIVTDRRAWNLAPGMVMRIQDVARGIPDTVVRIATMKDGTLLDGKISFDVVQDVFSLPARSFTEEQPNTWAPPNTTPCIGDHKVFEVPYFLLARTMRPADFDYITDTSAYVGTVAELGQPANVNYDVAVRTSAPTQDDVPSSLDQLYCGYVPPAP